MAQTLYTITHHKAHSACIVIRPDRLRAVIHFSFEERFGSQVKRFIPTYAFKLSSTFWACSLHRMHQPIRMMNTLCITRDLLADHTFGVSVIFGPAHAANGVLIQQLHFKSASRGTIMRADGNSGFNVGCMDVHWRSIP